MLTSPLPIGRLRDGRPANGLRSSTSALEPGPSGPGDTGDEHRAASFATRPYALSMLRCALVRRRLIGDTGYYRHRYPCDAFMAAKPSRPAGQRGRIDGKGYRRELYEDAIGRVLEKVSLG